MINVAAKYQDIRRIVLKHFSVPSIHPDDLVQDVVLRILEQNALPCAWDPSRSSFSHYVYMVAGNVAAKLARREGKQGKIEAALREELRPVEGQRAKIGSETANTPDAEFEAITTWAAGITGAQIQLSLFGWDPVEIATTVRQRRPRKARSIQANPAQLSLFVRAA